MTKHTELSIREMRIEDLATVFAIGNEVFTPEESPTLYRTWDEYEVVNLFSSDTETCLVAEIDDRVVGFALGTTIDKRGSSWRYGYLVWIAVRPDCAGAGIGSQLLDELTDIFIGLGVRMLLVDTDSDKEDALQFFDRMGFENPVEHVYLSKNLVHEPAYRRHRAREKRR